MENDDIDSMLKKVDRKFNRQGIIVNILLFLLVGMVMLLIILLFFYPARPFYIQN